MTWGQVRAWVWRFHTLALGDRLFGGLASPHVLCRRLFGQRLCVDVARANPQRLLYLEGERFIAERRIVRGLLRPGMHAVDVGANIGYYLLLLESRVGERGRVTCFEPEPANLLELERNVRANGYRNVRVEAAAAGGADGTVTLRAGINAAITAGEGDFTVPLVRLDAALPERVDFLKIDVEGYEGHVLAGAERILRQDRPALFVEIHPGFLAPPATVDGILDRLRATHPDLELWEIAPQAGLGEKVRARYAGRAARRVPSPAALLADCRAGRRAEPFWAVAPRPDSAAP